MSTPVPVARIVRDPAWLAHRYDPPADAVHFRYVPRVTHRAATFLTDEHLPAGDPVVLPLADSIAAMPPPAPVHFLFHSAFCLSTLLARAFDVEGLATGVPEPVILNDLVGWKRRGADPRGVARGLDGAMALLARPFAAGEAVIVKPSNIVNPLALAMLAMRPQAKALLLHAPLRTFLGSVARKGMWGRLWVRELFVGQLQDGIVDLGFAADRYLEQTDLQIAALGWLAQQALFARLVERVGPARVRTLDSDRLLAAPRDAVAALARLFGLACDAGAIIAGPAFTRHSKTGASFGQDARAEERRTGEQPHADEIEKVAIWAEAVAAGAGVPLRLPAPLLG
ncbi:hypothetical protein [Sphingomonas profundi]|uniref:hypothetical protein n=1 Tax=Alterirhizorhabdus profundi TaxID=2681549 RepID=UPI0012E7CB31|nr:hypothetical protein [Sphingomonas profundi]